MKATKEQLEMKERYLDSLKTLTSDTAFAERDAVTTQIQELQHRVNALKAPKDRVPGLKRAVKSQEGLLQTALQRQIDAAEKLDLAEKEVIDAQNAAKQVRVSMAELQQK